MNDATWLEPLSGPIELRSYDPGWPGAYADEAERIRAALGARAVRVEHVGSTAVPGLLAKPTIDVVLEVPDADDEAAYVPALEGAGYVLRVREPDWFAHRLFKRPAADVNLHAFSAGCAETERMVRFRDWLRAHPSDRDRYAEVKRVLVRRDWSHMQEYAEAKTEVVESILRRAEQEDRRP